MEVEEELKKKLVIILIVVFLLAGVSSALTSPIHSSNVQPARKVKRGELFDQNESLQEYSYSKPPEIEWNKTYGGTDLESAGTVVETSDGGYALAGVILYNTTEDIDFWLVKVDLSGNIQWNRTYGGAGWDWFSPSSGVVETSDGGYALAGWTKSFGAGSYDFWLVKVDSSGNMEWNETYGGQYGDQAYAGVVETSDGGYALAGNTGSFGAGYRDFWLVKVDSSGNIQWNKTYGGAGDDFAHSFLKTSDGGYALAGYTYSFGAGGGDFWLVKVDSLGNHQWNRTYGGTDWENAQSLVETSDGGYALAGYKGPSAGYGDDFWLVKVDSLGNHQWNKTYGGADRDESWSLVETSDGGYALAGYTYSFGAGGGDFWLIKLAPEEVVDWWPMFHHDPSHSGYSTSPAPSTNNTIWNYTTGYNVYSSPAVVDGRVYVGSGDHNVYCLDASTGVKIWNYTTGWFVFSSPAVVDGRVYVTSEENWPTSNGTIYCLNASTGAHIWNYTTGAVLGSTFSSPTIAAGRVYLRSVGFDDYNVYCLDALNGAKIWNYTTGGSVVSPPAVAYGRVYAGGGAPFESNKIYCLNASTGAYIWNYTVGDAIYSFPAVVDGKVYFGSVDNKTYCLGAFSGTHIWNYTTGWEVNSHPAVVAGRVYIASWDNKTYCLNASTGSFIWSYTTDWGVVCGPAIADGKVYLGSWDTKVYCLNALTGAKVWSYKTGGGIISSPAIADGKIYIGSMDDKVYAFGPPHDVAVTDVVTSKTGCSPMPTVGQNYTLGVNVTVENQGSFTEAFNVAAYANSTVIGSTTVNSLASGANITLTLLWNTTGFAYGNYTIKAVADTVLGETDTLDNTKIDGVIKVTVPGDIDGSCKVEYTDLFLFGKAWWGEPGDPNWNPNADLDDSGKVEYTDLFIFGKHWWQSC